MNSLGFPAAVELEQVLAYGRDVLVTEAEAIKAAALRLDEPFARACALMLDCRGRVVVVGVGVVPNTDWLADSGLTIDNGVVCDATLLAAPGVVVAGDVARWPNPLYGERPMTVEH